MAPVDPSIVAGLRGPQIPSPLQTLQTFATVQDIQERTEARRLAGEIGRVTFEHVRREANADADRLANAAMDQAAGV